MRVPASRIGLKELLKLIPPGIDPVYVGRLSLERESEKSADSRANFENAIARTNSLKCRQLEVFGSIDVIAGKLQRGKGVSVKNFRSGNGGRGIHVRVFWISKGRKSS